MERTDVYSQEQLDRVIKNGNPNEVAVIRFGGCCTPAIVRGNANVIASDNVNVVVYDNIFVMAHGNASVWACGDSEVEACDNVNVIAYDKATVAAFDYATVEAYDYTSVKAYGHARVMACDYASVKAYGHASVEAYDNTQVLSRATGAIVIYDSSRIMYGLRTIAEYCDHYGLDFGNTVKLYKAVHKGSNGIYKSDYDSSFVYKVGSYAVADSLTVDVDEECGHGIHMATLYWCLRYGAMWTDLAILEMEADANSIIIPKRCEGKVRTDKVLVLREVPPEEYWTLVKTIARQN